MAERKHLKKQYKIIDQNNEAKIIIDKTIAIKIIKISKMKNNNKIKKRKALNFFKKFKKDGTNYR